MLIACVQTDVTFADIETNLQRVIDKLHEAGRRGAKLVVFPECMLTGYGFDSREEAAANALPLDSSHFDRIAAAAGEYGLYVTVGFLEADGPSQSSEGGSGSDRLFNALALIGGDGMVGHYRKVHLPYLGVDRFVDRGDGGYRVHSAGELNVGLAICYDSSFPEPIRVLGLQGADVIALGTNWPVAAFRTAEVVPPARSMENHLYFVSANRVGRERGFDYCGRSAICGPDGIELARADGDEETILYAEIDPADARSKRIERTPGKHVVDRFEDRRPEFYGEIVKPVQRKS